MLVSLFALPFLFFSCTSDDDANPEPENEEEVITTVVVELVDVDNAFSEFRYQIIDNEVTVEEITLQQGKTYTASVQFFNETETPTEDITEEIEAEAEEHLICYEFTAAIDYEITDEDDNGKEIGINSIWVTDNSNSTGELVITLKHQPDIKASNDGTNCNLGETDVEATFPVTIE